MVDCPSSEDLLAFQKNELCDYAEIDVHLRTCETCTQEILEIEKHRKLYSQVSIPQFVPSSIDWEKTIAKERKPLYHHIIKIAAVFLVAATISFFVWPTSPEVYLTHGFLHPEQQTKPINYGKLSTKETIAKISVGKKISCSLSKNTQIILKNAKELHLSSGSIYLEVTPGSPLKIKTPHGVIDVLGTIFSVTTTNKETSVNVYRGRVKFTNGKDKVCVLEKNSKSSSSSFVVLASSDRIPYWVNEPLSLRIKEHNDDIAIFATNLTSDSLYLNRFSSTPNFLFNVKNIHSQEEYQTPVFSQTIIASKQLQTLRVPIRKILKHKGSYEVTLIFQDQIQTQNAWSGTIRSSTIAIDRN